MDIAVARTFLEVVKTGSFVGAAANLHVSQTAVSARIRVLENRLGRPVFVRNKAGARLTPAGERFLRFAAVLVQTWETARSAVALPPGRTAAISLGAELSLCNPLLSRWLVWMRRECPDIALRTTIETGERLLGLVQGGALDAAVLYGASHRPGLVAELLFEERLVLVRATAPSGEDVEMVGVDWGEEFAVNVRAAFPELANPAVSIDYGPLALDYVLAGGSAGYFREGFVRPQLTDGRLEIIANSPVFPYPAYLVSSDRIAPSMLQLLREGLRMAAAARA